MITVSTIQLQYSWGFIVKFISGNTILDLGFWIISVISSLDFSFSIMFLPQITKAGSHKRLQKLRQQSTQNKLNKQQKIQHRKNTNYLNTKVTAMYRTDSITLWKIMKNKHQKSAKLSNKTDKQMQNGRKTGCAKSSENYQLIETCEWLAMVVHHMTRIGV